MSRQEVYNMLVRAKRPKDLFGEVKDEKELKKQYNYFAKLIHPDTASANEQYLSQQGFPILQELYKKGIDELKKNIYNVFETVDLYKSQEAIFEIKIKGKLYKFYECICNGEISDIYRGLCDNDIVCLKIAIDEADNDLLKAEYDTLMKYTHTSMPIAKAFVKINGLSAIIMDEIKGESLISIMERNKSGIPAEHVMWIMERLFSVVGYLHSNFIIHENLIPENILIDKNVHNVILTGFSFHIPNANEDSKKYMIASEKFSAKEVSELKPVTPKSDIYSLGKLAIYMLGGSVTTNGMPTVVPIEIRDFIRKMVTDNVNERSDDAWKLWDEWRAIRTKLYGTKRFQNATF